MGAISAVLVGRYVTREFKHQIPGAIMPLFAASISAIVLFWLQQRSVLVVADIRQVPQMVAACADPWRMT